VNDDAANESGEDRGGCVPSGSFLTTGPQQLIVIEVERCAPRLDAPHQSIKPEPHASADQRPPYDDRRVDLSL
jgi:hypothetical protein